MILFIESKAYQNTCTACNKQNLNHLDNKTSFHWSYMRMMLSIIQLQEACLIINTHITTS